MDTMKSTLKRGRNVWDRINMPASEFKQRVVKIQKQMEKENVDVLLIYGNSPDEYGNPCYVTNFYTGMQGSLAIIPKKGQVALVFSGSARGIQYEKLNTWIDELRPSWDIVRECARYLEENKLIPSTIGLIGLRKLMPYHQLQSLYNSVSGCKMVDADYIVRDMRMVKSQRECGQIHRASRILSHILDSISNNTLSNMSEQNLEAIVYRVAYLDGAEDFRMLIARPQEEKWAFRPIEDIQIIPGESIIIFMVVEFERYWAEAIRTFKAEPARLVPARHEDFNKLCEQIMYMMKPGKTLSQFYREAADNLRKSGTGYMHEYGLGQGIGMSMHELPVIDEDDNTQLKEGMCLTLRLAMKDRKLGATMTGNTLCLTKDGPEILTEYL